MKLVDLIVAPSYLILFFIFIFIYSRRLRPELRNFFVFGYLFKALGGIAVGFIYYYYYRGGDTLNYFNYAQIINSSLGKSLHIWLKLMWSSNIDAETWGFLRHMPEYVDGAEYLVVRITAVFNLLSFGSYAGTALFFSLFSFLGCWLFFITIIKRYPVIYFQVGVAIFLIPSVIFWNSGILKDTLILGCLGIMVFAFDKIQDKKYQSGVIIMVLAVLFMEKIRGFMVTTLVMPLVIIAYSKFIMKYNFISKAILTVVGVLFLAGFLVIFANKLNEELLAFSNEVQISANYLYRISLRDGGSAYYLGDLDGSIESTFSLMVPAIWVSLFRPYPWESYNVVMLLSALESFLLLSFFIATLFKRKFVGFFRSVSQDLYLQYAIIFSILFAFIVGITTFNFGSLVRYRAPLYFFFITALTIIWNNKKLARVSVKPGKPKVRYNPLIR